MPAPIRIGHFRGERPGIGPRLLPDGYAQSARNCRLLDGQINPIKAVTNIEAITEVLDHRARTDAGYEGAWQYVRNRAFDRKTLFWTEGGGWAITGGKARHTPTTTGVFSQSLDRIDVQPRIKQGLSYTVNFTITDFVVGQVTPKIGGTSGTAVGANESFSQNITAGTGKLLEFDAASDFDGSISICSVSTQLGAFGAKDAGSPAWIRLEWAASEEVGAYDGWTVKTVSGTGSGQTKTIGSYFGNTNGKFHVAEVTSDWGTAPDASTVYELYRPVSVEEVESLYLFNHGGEFTFTAAATDIITATNHGLQDGDALVLKTTTTLPAGLTAGTQYFVVSRTPNTFKVALTVGGAAVDITDTGTGTHTASEGLWLRWGSDVDVAETPVAGDKDDILLWSGQGVGKISYRGFVDVDPSSFGTTGYPIQSYTLGVPEPRIDPADNTTGEGGVAGGDFAITYVADADNVDLFTDLQGLGWDGLTHKHFIVTVDAGVRIGSDAGNDGFLVVTGFPQGTLITMTNNGTMNGGHGAGGAIGTGGTGAGAAGGNGGIAMKLDAGFGAKDDDFTTDFATSTSFILETGHTYTDDMRVRFTTTGADLPDGLTTTDRYYVVEKETDKFKVSLTKGGAAETFGDDGTGTHSVHSIVLDLTNSATGIIFGPGGGGGGGGAAQGCTIVEDQVFDTGFLSITEDQDEGGPGAIGWKGVSHFRTSGISKKVTGLTASASTDKFTKTNHGLVNDNRLFFRTTGGLPAPIGTSLEYWVVSATANDFKVSFSQGGGAINLTTSGSGTHSCTHAFMITSGVSPSADTNWVAGRYPTGIAVPGSATIVGIEIQLIGATSAGASSAWSVQMVKANVRTGTAKSTLDFTTSQSTQSLGGASDMWGTTWTPTEINAGSPSGFGLSMRNTAASTTTDTDIDHAKIKVYYTDGACTETVACDSEGGAGGKGEGNTAEVSSTAGAVCGSDDGACVGIGTGGTGETGGARDVNGTVGTAGVGSTNCTLNGNGAGGAAGTKGKAINGVSLIATLVNSGTITGTQDG